MKVLRATKTELEGCSIFYDLMEMDGIYYFYGSVFSGGREVESCMTFGITDQRKRAELIYNVFVNEKVFPSHFYYVIDELMTEC